MRKPIIKFMAGALAAAMVVTSPITVFAENDGFLSHIFGTNATESTESQPDSDTDTTSESGTLVDGGYKVKVTWDEVYGTKSISNTGNLDDIEVSDDVTLEDYILGVKFDQDEINVIAGGKKQTVRAMVYTSNGEVLSSDKLRGVLSFRKIQLAAEGQDLTAAKVGYGYDATAGGMGAIARDTLEIRGEHGGAFVIEARIDTDGDSKYEFTTRVPVYVKEYSAGIKINDPGTLYLKNTYQLSVTRYADEECTTVSQTANDAITWSAYAVKNGKTVKATSYLTLKEDGTLVLKKDKDKIDADIFVQAVGEKGAIDTLLQLNEYVKEAKPVKALTDSVTGKSSAKNTIGWGREKNATADLSDTWTVTVKADPADTTDQIAWSVKNGQIAELTNIVEDRTKGEFTATIKALKVGKTTVTVQAASGKKVTYTVTVKAPLVDIDKVVKAGTENVTEAEIYVGQTIQLEAKKNPSQSTDSIKYVATTKTINGEAVDGKAAKALVSVNNKTGVVTTKVVKGSDKKVVGGTVEIVATGKNANTGETVTSKAFTLTIIAPEFTDTKLNVSSVKSSALGTFIQKASNLSAATDSIYVGKDTTYTITGNVTNKDTDDNLALLRSALSWTSNKSAIAAVSSGKTDALSSGKATVSASLVNVAGKKITAKVAVTSKQAVTNLQLNKTEITLNPGTSATKAVTTTIKVSKQLPAKCTKENITWTIKGYNADGSEATDGIFTLKSGKVVAPEIPSDLKKTSVTIQATGATVGQYAIVTAEAEHGAVATATVRVLEKTASVKFITETNNLKSTVAKADLTINAGSAFKYNLNDIVAIVTGSGKNQVAHRVAGKEVVTDKDKKEAKNYESVTFTTNKSGIVTIDDFGNVYGVKAGKVTITAKTPSGKSAKITITVK